MSFLLVEDLNRAPRAQITEQSRVGKLACQGGGEGCSASVAHMRNIARSATAKCGEDRNEQDSNMLAQ